MLTSKRKITIPKKWVGKNYFLNNLSFAALMQLDEVETNIAIVKKKNQPAGFIIELTSTSFQILREHQLI